MSENASNAAPIRLGIVGMGKITRDQHLPAIAADKRFELVAAASPRSKDAPVKVYDTLEEMLAKEPSIQAVALNTPPQVRHDLARTALAARKHVLLEKPPAAGIAAAEDIARLAREAGVTLFATWHSRHAPGVERARQWLSSRDVAEVEVTWKEDVRRWHPGQAWIFEAGGFGCFDPGINALSIVTRILPQPMTLQQAELNFPSNCDAPIAAELAFQTNDGAPVAFHLDFLQTGPQTWDIRVKTKDGGELLMQMGGAQLTLDGQKQDVGPEREYPGIYDEFARLILAGQSNADISPLVHVADAFLYGKRKTVEAFYDNPADAPKADTHIPAAL